MFNTVPNTEGNPIFSSYSTRTKGFNENMDEYVKAPNDLYIEEQKKKNQQIVGDVNKKALNDIPDMPKFLEEEYEDIQKMPKWFEELNVATPQEIEEWKNKGGMGIAEAWEKNNKWASFAPYINTTRDAADAITASVLLNRAKNGEELSLEQKEKLVDYLRDMKELEVRGFTFGGGTVNAILASIPYLEEFGIGLAAAGEGVGLASLGKTLSTIGAKRAARKAVEQSLKAAAIKSAAPAAVKTTIPLSAAKKIYRDTLTKTTTTQALRNVGTREALTATAKSLPSVVGSSAKFAVTKMPHSLMGGIAERQISSGVYVSDAGSAVFSDSENLALSVMKSLAETTFEALTETAGWAFSPVVNYIAKPVRNILPKRFFTEFEKLVTSRYGMPAANALKKYGYDGVIEEMGEELLNRFLCQVFGLNGLEEYNFDGFMNNVLYANDPSQWAQEALSFAAVGAAGHSVAGAGSRIADEWRKRNYNRNLRELTDRANRYINSPMERYSDEMRKAQQERLERFYLEQGLVKIRGSQSLAEKKLREIWTSQNVDESLQDDILKDMSELDIRKELKKTIENTSNLTKEEASERIIKDLTNKFIDNKTFRNEKDARSVASLFAAPLEKLSEVTGQSLEEIMQEEMPSIQREAENAAEENGINIAIERTINERLDALNELPDDFSDEVYIQNIIDDISILEKIQNQTLREDEYQKANEVMQRLGITENNNSELYQPLDETGIKNIEENFDDTVENITGYISDDIRNILLENNISDDEFSFEDIRIYGSYSTGENNENSDLDFLVQYSGSMREDDAFNMFHAEELTINDKNGTPVVIDINPINVETSGTIDDKLSQMDSLFQSAETAGAETSADISAAQEEWETKGTDSRFFKKWFGDSKVVDESGEPLVVYHGTTVSNIEIFEPNRASTDFDYPEAIYFSDSLNIAKTYGDTYHKNPMQVYLKMENPLELDAQGQTYNDFYDELKRELKYAVTNNDGVIVRNIRDDWAQNDGGEIATTYIVFNPEQIKAVNNYGTFDAENPNIYYQSVYHGTPYMFDEFSLNNIGTGEGAQAHGWGLYFAENREVSENYRRRLSSIGSAENRNIWVYKNKEYKLVFNEDENEVEILGKTSDLKDYELEILKAFYDPSGRTEDEIFNDVFNEINDTISELENEGNKSYSKYLEKLYRQKDMLDNKGFPQRVKQNEGQLFEVDIPENDVLLDENKTFNMQSPKVKKSLKNVAKSIVGNTSYKDLEKQVISIQNEIKNLVRKDNKTSKEEQLLYNLRNKFTDVDLKYMLVGAMDNDSSSNGRRIYEILSDILNSDKEASLLLNNFGIKGITYDGRQDGRCYVVFDDKAVDIVEKFYQEDASQNDLIMTHATKVDNIDAIIDDGVLVAPSMAITKREQNELSNKSFGDILFIRNPESIDYKRDNIYDRDIYSPRIPEPDYKTKRGGHVSAYEYSGMVRQWDKRPEDFIRIFGMTFDEYFDGAKKVIFEGFTPSGNRKLVDYNAKNLLKYIKRKSLLGGENTNYGLSSFLARLSEKQTSKKKLKQTAANSLKDRTDADKEYQKLRDEYADLLFGDITKYYRFSGNSWQKISDEDFESIMVAIATGNERELSEYVDTENLPEELYNKLRDFTNRALRLPRSYFEAKPIREISLSEFPFALAEIGVLSDIQKTRLENKGVKVIEYPKGGMQSALEEISKVTPEIYFQFAGEFGANNLSRYENSDILDRLQKAKDMEAKGAFSENIRRETGWFRGADKKWRFEISDKDAEIYNKEILGYHEYDAEFSNEKYYEELNKINRRMDKLIKDRNVGKISQEDFDHQYDLAMFDRDYLSNKYSENEKAREKNIHYLANILKHDALFAAYPELKYLNIEVVPSGQTFSGRFTGRKIQIPSYVVQRSDFKKILMHEIQHYIQGVEDFNSGGNPESVERQLRNVIDEVSNTVSYKKRQEILSILDEEYEDHYVLAQALQTLRVQEKEEEIFKTWWWTKNGSWWVPRKTRKKMYRAFMNEWVPKYFASVRNDMRERGKFNDYNNYLEKGITELRRLYKNSQARRNRLWKKTPRDIAYNFRDAIERLEKEEGEYSRSELKMEFYKQLAGETEARNTEARIDMSDEERKNTSPKSTQEYSDSDQFVIFSDGTTLSYSMPTPENEPVQTNLIYDNLTARKLRNKNYKGAFVPAENLIELFKNADESTIIHEFAHWWLTRLEKYSKDNEELALDLAEVRKFVKNDGGAFTREQHEKFARGFEAYIRNGSARSNRLKRIFEDFKNALIQIYDSIKKLVYVENGEEHSFTEADVANLERLFERLLTTENERIKKTVFDRCDEINERINDIKSRQEEEMKELDEIWKENIAANNRASDKKRKVDEYLQLAENAINRVPKEVREMKQRYKDATLNILAIATGMKKNAIANPRNWEKVQMALENADDKITTSGGMRAEWEEFYSDTGVSYDNDEIGGDYNLAEQAFKVLTDGTYNFGNMNEDDIGRFYGKFEYLYSKVQTLKGEEKTVALEALYSLFNDMPEMPDEVTSDVVEKLGKIEVDYEEGQREDFNRRRYPSIPVVQQLQYYVTNKLSELKVYDPNVRYKVRISKSHNLYKAIKHATSVNSTKRIIRKINEYVISDLENQAKSILHKEIQRQIKTNSKLVKVGTIKKGKFDWKTNTVFSELAELNKLGQKDAFKEYSLTVSLDNAAASEDRDVIDENVNSTPEFATDFQSNLKRKFLEYRSRKIKDLDLLMTRSLLEDIMTLKFEGRRAKSEQELAKRLQQEDMKTDLVERLREIKNNRAAQEVAKFIMGENPLTTERTLANWETSLNTLFGKEVAQRYSLLKLESDAEVYAYKHYAEFCRKAMEIYGLDNPVTAKEKIIDAFNRFVDFGNIQPLVKLMQEFEEEVYSYKEVTFSKETGQFVETGVQLSKAEIITLYTWSLNEELEQRIFTQYGLEQVKHMFETVLTDEDKQLAWLLIDTCDGMYNETNDVFIRTLGLSLPRVENYFPSKTVRVGSEIDMLHEHVVRSSNPSFIKERKKCNRIKMKPDNPISILLPHINKTARYVILSERLNYLNTIFKDATLRAAMKEVFDGIEMPTVENRGSGKRIKGRLGKRKRTVGDRIHDTLLNQLGSSTFENYVRGLNVGKDWRDAIASNYITSRIGGNLKVALGQLTSIINYAEKMPINEWVKGFTDTLKHPKVTIEFMLNNCDYLKARMAGNSMNEIMSRITDETDRFRTFKNFWTTNTKYGDLIAISFGGKPYVDYLIKQGMTIEQAFEKFVEDTLRSQQSGHNSATSVWQKKMSENFFTRMMFAFNNTTLQYERKFMDAVASRSRGEISNKEFIKAILIYKVINPVLFSSFLTNLSIMQLVGSLIRGDDDDALERFGIDAVSSMIFANMGAYGFAGMAFMTIGRFMMAMLDKNEYKPFLSAVPIISDIEDIGKQLILKNEVTVADWVEAMALVGGDATGVPLPRITNSIGGISDIVKGETGAGLLRMMGWGKYRSYKATTGQPPERD